MVSISNADASSVEGGWWKLKFVSSKGTWGCSDVDNVWIAHVDFNHVLAHMKYIIRFAFNMV